MNYLIRKKCNINNDLNTIMIGKDLGNWKDSDYTFAQRYTSLEFPELPVQPREVSKNNSGNSKFVNCKEMYKAIQIAQKNINKIEATVLSIKKEKNIWVVIIKKKNNEIYRLYAKNVDLCMGFGQPRKLFNYGMMSEITNDNVRKLIREHYTRRSKIINANSYLLSDIHLFPKETNKKIIVVYGGGGSASACVRKAILNKDNGTLLKEISPKDHVINDVYWISRSGITGAGEGDLVLDVIKYMTKNDNNCKKANKRLYYNTSFKKNGEGIQISSEKKLKLTFNCDGNSLIIDNVDQLIYGIGQDSSNLYDGSIPGIEKLINDQKLKKNISPEIIYSKIFNIPLAIKLADGLFVHGASCIAIRKLDNQMDRMSKSFSASQQDEELIAAATPDGNAPGTMPPVFAAMRLFYSQEHNYDINYINLNTDFRETMLLFFSKFNINYIIIMTYIMFISGRRLRYNYDTKKKNSRNSEGFFINDIQKFINRFKLSDIVKQKDETTIIYSKKKINIDSTQNINNIRIIKKLNDNDKFNLIKLLPYYDIYQGTKNNRIK